MKRLFRNAMFYVLLAILVLFAGASWMNGQQRAKTINLTELEQKLAAGQVKKAEIIQPDDKVVGELADGTQFESTFPNGYADTLTQTMRKAKAPDGAELPVLATKKSDSVLMTLLIQFVPLILLFGAFFFIMNQMQGGGSRVMQFGKAKAKQQSKDSPKVTFSDVAGCDEAIEELQEIKDFLENPARFQAMGAKIPKGVLLFGPPGTGKTLLAKAVAGEAGVPFFSISGSDFVEMFVGVGASRVRDLFEQAKAAAPAIIFVDEIDAVGRHRGAGLGGGHDEREQTLNQMLVEMDGFDTKTGVIMIAATNRPDILDPALLRPGRFDRQITVDRPDLTGRKRILEVHAKGKPLAAGTDLEVLAKRTPGFTGADLANLLNEAALLSARHGFSEIGQMQLDEAIDRVVAGPERRTLVLDEDEKRNTAYHESGHAIVGWLLPDADRVHKVTIIPRGRALGITWSLPGNERNDKNRTELQSFMAMALGGRTAEELVNDEITSGASSDIEKVTETARNMVTQWGMSERLGPRKFGQQQGEVFLGRDMGHEKDYSDDIAAIIDDEIDRLIEDAHRVAREILTTHRDLLDRMARLLIEKETLDTSELEKIFEGVPPWSGPLSSSSRTQRGEVITPLSGMSSSNRHAEVQADHQHESPQDRQPPASRQPRTWLDRLRGEPGPSPA